MCGRTAQTRNAVRVAAEVLGAPQPREESQRDSTDEHRSTPPSNEGLDNYNLSPGMDALVFYKKGGVIHTESKVWGLITKPGTVNNPLPTGMGQHFSALMYNARSDTLFMKQTFGNLIGKKQACIVAVDGWFEWKQEVKGKKQPYFVKDASRPFLFMPGLWTQVATGRSDDPYLTTFTILTTEAVPALTWLHSRMPVCCFDTTLAQSWLDSPTQACHESLLSSHHQQLNGRWAWHAVTDEMTNLKFRSPKAIAPWTRPTIKNFFGPKSSSTSSSMDEKATSSDASTSIKRVACQSLSSPATKKLKKGSISSFFSPKTDQST